jgi:hypothetical protein
MISVYSVICGKYQIIKYRNNMTEKKTTLRRVISGGQTGVDRAALDAAMTCGFNTGGWCPKGRQAEDGIIPEKYPLKETKSSLYQERTRLNVKDSEGTLLLCTSECSGGTERTRIDAEKLHKKYLILNPNDADAESKLSTFIQTNKLRVLNVAGPRESSSPGIYLTAFNFLTKFLSGIK